MGNRQVQLATEVFAQLVPLIIGKPSRCLDDRREPIIEALEETICKFALATPEHAEVTFDLLRWGGSMWDGELEDVAVCLVRIVAADQELHVLVLRELFRHGLRPLA